MAQGSRVEIVHQALRRAIVEQALEPGAKLPEDAIGERFGVSRTIVRRALERLAAEELVEMQPNRGASVVAPTLEEARDLFEIRMELEDVVVRRLCGRLTPAQIERLNAAVTREEEAHLQRRQDYIRLSGEFHAVLAEMTESPMLRRYLRQLVWRSALVLRLHGRPDWEDCNVHEHHELIAALIAGDVDRCRSLMAAHLRAVLTRGLKGGGARSEPSLWDILAVYAAPDMTR
jgi:DNA-binding GntR family transcriptional regulator